MAPSEVLPYSARITPDAAWRLSGDEVARQLQVDPDHGLSQDEAQRRLAEAGPNELVEAPRKPPWRMFVEQFANTMIVVLLLAAVVTAVIGEARDTVVIAVIVVLNAAIGFVQEYRAERAMAALQRMTAATARVVREGETVTAAARDLVPGDLVRLDAGDVVPADLRLIEAPNLRVDEAPLTGESLPIDKTAEALPAGAAELVGDRTNMAFKGTPVVHGRGTGIVVATGMATELGQIASLLQARQAPPTPLQLRLAVLGRRLAVASLVVCAVVFVAGVARGEPTSVMFLTAVSLAVAAIPEALPAVVTVALALGAQRMARHRALVRKLPAVETLGSVTVICTDKTGTLTQGRMRVERAWTPSAGEVTVAIDGPAVLLSAHRRHTEGPDVLGLMDLARAAVLCNDATVADTSDAVETWTTTGDPTESALLVFGLGAGLRRADLQRSHPRIAEVPFDAGRKRMTTLHRVPDGRILVASKGALEAILPAVSVASPAAATAREIADRYGARGYRVLAIAGALRDAVPAAASAEHDLTLYGLIALADAAREESRAAVDDCRAAGILPVMITGDHPATARAIAEQVGILDGARRVLTGGQLAAEGAQGLSHHVADVAVYARTTPEQKLDIVEAWKARGDTVAMTGDGVNDAPALRRADIGVAMGIAGSDVSKEAADMVLADDNFATIVTAVREGRRIYDNIRRFVRYTLTSNSGEIWVMFLAPFAGLPLPLLPVQILWINLVTDGLPGLALGVEPPERDVMRRPPRRPAESVFAGGLWQHVGIVGLLMGAIPLALGTWGYATGRPWQTMVFTSLALLQLGHALAVRSERESLWTLGLRSNLPLLLTVVGTVALQIAVVYLPAAQALLRTTALSVPELAVVLAASTGVFWVVEVEKLLRRRRRPPAA